MATHADFGKTTDGTAVTEAFSAQIAGKVIVITGVNAAGIGGSTAEALAPHSPKLLILTGRSQPKVEEVIKNLHALHPNLNLRFLQLDLSSQKSVRTAAKEVLSYSDVPQIDILINNAGVMSIPERTLSEDGLEMQFATNHIGHFLFTNLILSKLVESASKSPSKGSTRIVNVSSRGIRCSPVRFSDPNFTKSIAELPEIERPSRSVFEELGLTDTTVYSGMVGYGQSKTANVLFSLALTHRLYESHGVLSFGVHPGGIMTELGRHMDPAVMQALVKRYAASGLNFKTLAAGSSTTLVAALDPKLGPANSTGNGVYLSDCQLVEAEPWATDPMAAEKLWALSEELVGEQFQVS